MDMHYNDLVFEEGFEHVVLNTLSFRDIDQEFIIVHSEDTYASDKVNNLYYCFIKPYEGLLFRLIGISDENEDILKVDEDKNDIEDIQYSQLANADVSKIIENGDLLSNQLLVNLTFDYYDSNEDLEELMHTRRVEWVDRYRLPGNPDYVFIGNDNQGIKYKIIKCLDQGLEIEDPYGTKHILCQNGTVG